MDASEVEQLFAQTLVGDYENEDAWKAVAALRQDGSVEIFQHAAAWCSSDDPLKRARAADILSQLRRGPAEKPEWLFREQSFPLVARMLEDEQSTVVLNSAIGALGHLRNEMGIPLILGFKNHPDGGVRFAVAVALGCFPNDSRSVDGLVKLTSDSESEVRDWAVFGLGVLGDADSPVIREAMIRCLNDANENVREEAAVGLGSAGMNVLSQSCS